MDLRRRLIGSLGLLLGSLLAMTTLIQLYSLRSDIRAEVDASTRLVNVLVAAGSAGASDAGAARALLAGAGLRHLSIRTADVPNHFRSLRTRDYDLGQANWYADFNDASNFLDLLRGRAGNNYAGYRNPAFDRLMDKAAAEPDARARGALLVQAEKTALADYPWIPLRFPAQTDLVAPGLKGWVANPRDLHRSRWLSR